MRSRKGALELSVTGVVVLIIAIVVLGSVIFFIRSFFGETQGLIGQQLASVKEQLRKTIDESGEPLAMDFGRELKLKRGTPQEIYLGMRNDFTNAKGGDSVCYLVQFVCLRSFSTGLNCGLDTVSGDAQNTAPTVVGGIGISKTFTYTADTDPNTGKPELEISTKAWVNKMLDLWDIPNRETDVNPVMFQVSGVAPDTYQMELRVYTLPDYGDCGDITSLNGAPVPWQSKRFLIELT